MINWIFAADQPIDYKLGLAAVAVVALALQVVLQVLKWRREASVQPAQDATIKILEAAQSACDAAQRNHEAVQGLRAILTREHPQTQQLRIYTPLRLEERLVEIERRLDELTATSGVWTDPGLGRKPR